MQFARKNYDFLTYCCILKLSSQSHWPFPFINFNDICNLFNLEARVNFSPMLNHVLLLLETF